MIGGGRFVAPEGVAVSAAGNVYVADGGKNRVQEIVPRP
jgi:DNA-binding beta-propeller fold protein YncE